MPHPCLPCNRLSVAPWLHGVTLCTRDTAPFEFTQHVALCWTGCGIHMPSDVECQPSN